VTSSLNNPYSAQYTTTTREGHEHPPPTFGAPTLIWHLGISPHWPKRAANLDDPIDVIHKRLAQTYEGTRTAFFRDVNRVLEALQRAAGYPSAPIKTFDPEDVPAPWTKPRRKDWEPFYVASPSSLRFTLWWSDANTSPSPEPGPDALRVKVLVGVHRDYITLSFYLDAAKPWDQPPQIAGGEIAGLRRERILSEADRVRSICEARMVADANGNRPIDREVLPEHGVSGADAATLLSASRYLYAQLWEEFCPAMGLDKLAGGATARIFASFRGLILSTDGLPEASQPRKFPRSSGADTFPRFKGNGGIDHTGTRSSDQPNEANAVVKAFWPFVRRVTPDADQKEFVACGVMSWRALYITALNCPPSHEPEEEARSIETDIPAGELPRGQKRPGAAEPIRYLLLSKGEPHRRQIGRIADRINSMGTMRLIALRDYNIIRETSTHIQLRGQELDTMMRKWSTGRAKIRKEFEPQKQGKSDNERRLIQDREDTEIQKLADRVENDLIDLSAALDAVGEEADHGLHFRINRSRYYVCEFESLLASLRVGNIDTWVSYDQFVTRGLKPAFDFIDGVGVRLLGLRSRLQSVLEGIETSALVKQSAATRENTAQLRNIADAFARLQRWLKILGLVVTATGLLVTLFGYQGVLGRIIGLLQGQ
jgi:hypothetical protein